MEIYLIRHTKPAIEDGICYGQSDVDLSETFLDEADLIKQKLPDHFDIVYSSTLNRCKKLAEQLSTNKVIYNDSLKELNFGDWELKKWDEINQTELNRWMDDFVNIFPPNGENYLSLFERVKLFWENSIVNSKHKTIAIVTHAGVIRSILALILNLNLKNTFNLNIDNSKTTRIDIINNFTTIKYINC